MPSEKKPKDKRMQRLRYATLPRLPMNCLMLGKCGSGKSSILWSMLNEGYMPCSLWAPRRTLSAALV